MTARYDVVINGVTVSYDASNAAPGTMEEILTGLVDAINNELTLAGMVTATLNDRNGDNVADEILVQNMDNATTIRTEAFSNDGAADVRQRQVDGCSEWDPERLVEARGVGSSGCVQVDVYYRNPLPLKAWAAFSHMHLIGQTIETEIMSVVDDGTVSTPVDDEECYARTDQWDFDWQRTYWFEEPKTVPRQGLVRLRCRFDNSGSSEEVRLGDGSGSEMCLALLYLTL